jgi:hypothetical protein
MTSLLCQGGRSSEHGFYVAVPVFTFAAEAEFSLDDDHTGRLLGGVVRGFDVFMPGEGKEARQDFQQVLAGTLRFLVDAVMLFIGFVRVRTAVHSLSQHVFQAAFNRRTLLAQLRSIDFTPFETVPLMKQLVFQIGTLLANRL